MHTRTRPTRHPRNPAMHLRLPAILLLAAALSGCASYVNIPADSEKDIAINAINAPPTPGVISAALDHVLRDFPPPATPYGIRLPAEASESTWQKVARQRDGALPFAELPLGQPAYDVRSIRIRGSDAWVDIVVPETIDNRPLVELRLEGWVDGWKVTSVRRWSASVIRVRESSGQYVPTSTNEPALRPIVATTERRTAAAEPPSIEPSAEEVEPAAPQDRPLTPLRPVKSDSP